MKTKQLLIGSIYSLLIIGTAAFAQPTPTVSNTQPLKSTTSGVIAPQYIVIANSLGMPENSNTASDITIQYFISQDNKDLCWTQDSPPAAYQGDPIVARAGLPSFGCKKNVQLIKISPNKNSLGQVYDEITVKIDPDKHYTFLIINQLKPPMFDPSNGTIQTRGTINVTQTTE